MWNLRRIFVLTASLLAAFATTAHAADTVLYYRGRLLKPNTGSGVPHVRNLHFRVSGHLPMPGGCRTDFAILAVSDGAFSLKDAIARGYSLSAHNRVKICSDAQTGALSESLNVRVEYFADGNLVASYAWLSSDPRRGRAADSVIEFANIEYHVSEAKRVGRLMAMDESPK
jgi:hypothetical protein